MSKKIIIPEFFTLNVIEFTVIVTFLVASVYALATFRGNAGIVYTIFIVGGGIVAYLCARTEVDFVLKRRNGFKGLFKYCLHLLWVLPVIWGVGALLGWLAGVPYDTITAFGYGIDPVGFMAIIACIIMHYIKRK